MSTHTNSPDHAPIQPLHNPSLAAHVIVSHALNVRGSVPAFAKKDNRDDASGCTGDPKYFVSPTDGIETPCTRKLRAAKKKHFDKPPKAVQLFPQKENSDASEEEQVSDQVAVPIEKKMEDDNENPF